jgi:hypothetical protein
VHRKIKGEKALLKRIHPYQQGFEEEYLAIPFLSVEALCIAFLRVSFKVFNA